MADYVCDGCQDEPAAFTVTAHAQAETQFLGPHCIGVLGATILAQIDPEALAVFLPAVDEPTDLEPAPLDNPVEAGATITEPTPITKPATGRRGGAPRDTDPE
jgi:hypothetical protein